MYASDRKTAGELRAIGEQRGWRAKKEISAAELHQFSSLQIQFHEAFSPEAMKLALTEPKRKADEKKGSVERMWKGSASTDESEAAWKTGEKFMELYPAVRPTDSATGSAFKKYMRLNNLDPRELASWEQSLQSLAAQNQPEIFLSPKAAGVGPEEELGGYSLRSYPKLYLLLQRAPDAATRKFRESYKPELSADEFIKQAPELQNGPSYAERQAIDLAVRSLPYFERDYVATEENGNKLLQYIHKNNLQFNLTGLRIAFNALKNDLELKPVTVQAGKTTMTNYEARETGEPWTPEKLTAKIRSLSSTQLAQFFRDNPSARRAVDAVAH